jgi:hypothetical protein
LNLCIQEPEVLRVLLSQSLFVDVVPEKEHRRRNATLVERGHGGLQALKDGVVVELLGSRVPDQEDNRILIIRPLIEALR